MDDTCRLRGFHAAHVCPGPRLVGARGEERFEVQQFVGRFYQACHARFLKAEVFEEHLPLLVAFQFGDVGLRRCCDDEHFGFLAGDGRLHRFGIGIARHGAFLVHVADVEHRFVGQQVEVGDQLAVFLLQFHRAGAVSLFECGFVLQQQLHGTPGVLVAARGGLLLRLGEAVFDGFEVFELQLRVDDALVAHGVDRPVHMGDVAVVEAAQYMDDGVRVADVGQEFVAEPFAFRRPFHQPGDVHDLDRGRDHPFGIVDLRQFDKPLVGNRDDAHIGLDGTERKVSRLRLRIGQAVEKGRFTHVGQTYDAAL